MNNYSLAISDPLRVFCASIAASLYVEGHKDIWPEFLKSETALDLSDFGNFLHELLALKGIKKNSKKSFLGTKELHKESENVIPSSGK